MTRAIPLAVVLMTLGSGACSQGAATQQAAPRTAPAEPARPPLTGPVSRSAVEESFPAWTASVQRSFPNEEIARKLTEVPTGARVVVYLGTWCSDSRREVARMWKAFDIAGGTLPFEIEYVAVDRSLHASEGVSTEAELEYVPTFIVQRNGFEVGRIVETAPGGIEQDLHALLSGNQTGIIGRDGAL